MRRDLKYGVLFGALLLFLAAQGCESLGLVTPRTVPDKIAYGYATVTQIAQATTSLLQQKKISVETAKRVQSGLNLSLSALNESRDLHYSGNQKDALAKVNAALKVLDAMELELKKGDKP